MLAVVVVYLFNLLFQIRHIKKKEKKRFLNIVLAKHSHKFNININIYTHTQLALEALIFY